MSVRDRMLSSVDKFARLMELKHDHNIHYLECLKMYNLLLNIDAHHEREQKMKKIWDDIVLLRKEIERLTKELDDDEEMKSLVNSFHEHFSK